MATLSASCLAPTGTLRAVFLGRNPAQASRDTATGRFRGVAVDLTAELAARLGVPMELTPVVGAEPLIGAVEAGAADIGFVAYARERAGTVAFSQTYMLVQQSFIVPEASDIRHVADIDRPGRRIGGGKGDSLALYLRRTLQHATLVETENSIEAGMALLEAVDADAFGANRQRLATMLAASGGYRALPDNIYAVTQTMIVEGRDPERLAQINAFIDDMRASGRLAEVIAQSGTLGLDPAPAGYDRR